MSVGTKTYHLLQGDKWGDGDFWRYSGNVQSYIHTIWYLCLETKDLWWISTPRHKFGRGFRKLNDL
jgi:hypothetical protein